MLIDSCPKRVNAESTDLLYEKLKKSKIYNLAAEQWGGGEGANPETSVLVSGI